MKMIKAAHPGITSQKLGWAVCNINTPELQRAQIFLEDIAKGTTEPMALSLYFYRVLEANQRVQIKLQLGIVW